jgi:signal transduction histidine kinase
MKEVKQPTIRRRLSLRRWVPFAVLALGGMLTAFTVISLSLTEEARARAAFESDTLETWKNVNSGLDRLVEVARLSTALLAVSQEINYVEFRSFVRGLQLRERYPAIDGIGFSQRIGRRDIGTFLRQVHLDGVPELDVWPAGLRSEYHTILFLEPGDARNKSAVGFDMATSAALLPAMERARDSGAPAISERLPIAPFSGAGEQTRAVVYLPVYRAGAALRTIENRRRALVGFVFSPFRPEVPLQQSVAATASSLAVDVYDTEMDPRKLLYRSAIASGEPRFHSTYAVQIAGRRWLLSARSRESLAPGPFPVEAQRTLVAGALLSLLLFALMRAQIRAWEASARHGAELRAADRAKDQFLATLSHELRTPLNAVLGWVTMLRTGAVRDDRREHALEVVERNARAQAQLIEDLLDTSRILMGKMRVDMRPLPIVPAVLAVLDSVRPTADAKGIHLHGPELRDLGPATIAADPGRFEQIVSNLLSNAIKFTPPGGDVWLNVRCETEQLRLSVRDTGVGIDADFLPHVFDRFRQADGSTTRTHAGIGVGLAIVRHLVEAHGGFIETHSDGPNRGAEFVVMLPLSGAVGPVHADFLPSTSLGEPDRESRDADIVRT